MAADDIYADVRSDNLKTVLSQLGQELRDAQDVRDSIARELDVAETRVNELSTKIIPEAAVGLHGDFVMEDGKRMTIGEVITASIAGDKKIPAIKWLDENGYGGLVKRRLVFEFDRKDNTRYREFMDHIRKLPKVPVFREEHNVHPQTLMAWVREKLKEGVDLPRDLLGIYQGFQAKIKD